MPVLNDTSFPCHFGLSTGAKFALGCKIIPAAWYYRRLSGRRHKYLDREATSTDMGKDYVTLMAIRLCTIQPIRTKTIFINRLLCMFTGLSLSLYNSRVCIPIDFSRSTYV